MKAVREEEVKLRGVGFVKQVRFKPGVKEREGVMEEQSGESEEKEVMSEGIGESEMESAPDVHSVQLEDRVSRTESGFIGGTSRHDGLDADWTLAAQNEPKTSVVASRHLH